MSSKSGLEGETAYTIKSDGYGILSWYADQIQSVTIVAIAITAVTFGIL